jgi:hypothetical protein
MKRLKIFAILNLIVFGAFALFSSCKQKEHKQENLFSRYKKHIDNSGTLSIDDNLRCNHGIYGYNMTLSAFGGKYEDTCIYSPEYQTFIYNGFAFFNGNKLKGVIGGTEGIWVFSDAYVIFDFNMRPKESQRIKWRANRDIEGMGKYVNLIEYDLVLHEIFYDDSLQDSIYHFEFDGYNDTGYKDNSVFYVGKDVGIVGSYFYFPEQYSEKEKNDKMLVFKPTGNIYIEESKYSVGSIK